MPEEDGMASKEPQHDFGGRCFGVGTSSYCVWDWDLRKKNLEYLESLDPDYFAYVGRANAAHLDADDPKDRLRAATAIRTAYHHGIESFFALLLAMLQAPSCVVGWMQVYSPADLRNMVRAVDPIICKGEQRRQAIAYREQMLPYVWTRPHSFHWQEISRLIHSVDGDEREVKNLQESFGRLWSGFAKDLSDDTFVSEYNSIKHGLRARSGGFSVRIGLEPTPGESPPAGAMHTLGSSEHGSSFFMPRTFVEHPGEKDRKARIGHGKGQSPHFRIRRQALNWDPRGLCQALSLISCSIDNVRSRALLLNGSDPSSVQFVVPEDNEFKKPFGQHLGVSSMNMERTVLKDYVGEIGRDELAEEIRKRMSGLRDRLEPTSSDE